MKKLILITALSTIAAAGAMAQSDTSTKMQQSGAAAKMQQGGAAAPAFLVSDFTGMTLYSLGEKDAKMLRDKSGSDRNRMQQRTGAGTTAGTAGQDRSMSYEQRDGLRWNTSETKLSESDSLEEVADIGEVVMNKKGEIQGIVLDVGGFLGMGERKVMVDIDELHFISEESDPKELDDFRVVTTLSKEELENLPEWDEDKLRAGFSGSDKR